MAIFAQSAANTEASALSKQQHDSKAIAQRAYEENLARFKNDPDVLVLPGLTANRKEKQIKVWGKATGIRPNDPIEFLLIPEDSSKDYEAVAVSFTKASDIYRALIFIGMTPGRPVDAKRLQFWPKGERVIVTVEWGQVPGDVSSSGRVASAEELVMSTTTRKPLKTAGLVFVKPLSFARGKGPNDPPDYEPFSIISVYNEPDTILDVPWRAPQSEFYTRQKMNPLYRFQKDEPLLIRMQPERTDGTCRVLDMLLRAQPREKSRGEHLQDVVFTIKDMTGKSPDAGMGLKELLEKISKLVAEKTDPFVTIEFDEQMTVQALHELCGVLVSADTDDLMRIEPPSAGHLYYRAFLPDEKYRNRVNRIVQPTELHLSMTNSDVSATVVRIQQVWRNDKVDPDLKTGEQPVDSIETLTKLLHEELAKTPVLFVFTPAQLRYGELMRYIRPVLSMNPIVYVYVTRTE